MVYQNEKYGEDFTPERPYDGYGFTVLNDNKCPHCGAELDGPEEINGKYWPEENYYEVDAYKYTCPECGAIFFTEKEI